MNNEKKYKRHWAFVVTDKKYLYPLVLLMTLMGIFAACYWKDPTYFSRVGNFIIGIGVWMSMRYTLREGINRYKNGLKSSPTLPGEGPGKAINPAYFNEIAYSIGDAHLQLHGFYIVIYGSTVGAFGDLIISYFTGIC